LNQIPSSDAVAFHSQIASEFHESYKADPNRLERIDVWRTYLARHAKPAELAYDLGCGSGMLTCEIAGRADKVIAIDGSDAMLAIAGKNTAGRGFHNVSFRQARLPIADTTGLEPADLVISSSVIEYLDTVEGALDFVRKLMKPGAMLFFSMSNRDSISRRLVRVVHRLTGRPRYFGFVKHFLNEDDTRRLLAQARLDYVDHVHFGGHDRLNRVLGTVFPKRFSTNMILIVAQRPAA
jgi:2-polyprenyl-3-methyl-5-hydroxy-6-metoxy-1,4-benzoquinol methylase